MYCITYKKGRRAEEKKSPFTPALILHSCCVRLASSTSTAAASAFASAALVAAERGARLARRALPASGARVRRLQRRAVRRVREQTVPLAGALQAPLGLVRPRGARTARSPPLELMLHHPPHQTSPHECLLLLLLLLVRATGTSCTASRT